MSEAQVQWLAPAAMWPHLTGQAETQANMRKPQILRFASDAFMEEYLGALNHQPERLIEWQAQPETWQGPAADPLPVEKLPPLVQRLNRLRLASATPANLALAAAASARPAAGLAPGGKLKLYQPGHGRFYLVTGCLVCRLPGLPDRAIRSGAGERASYVVRRLRPRPGAPLPAAFDLSTCDEYAYLEGQGWQKAAPDALNPGEEQIPLFGVNYIERDGRRRRVLGAVIPVGKRETYLGAPAAPTLPDLPTPAAAIDPRKVVFMRQVADPWRSLVREYEKAVARVSSNIPGGQEDEAARAIQEADDLAVWLSWLVLSDFGDYLAKYLPEVWAVVEGKAGQGSLAGDGLALYETLRDTSYTDPATGEPMSLAVALLAVRAFQPDLDSTTLPYSTLDGQTPPSPPFPGFRFRLHNPALAELVNGPTPDPDAPPSQRPADVLDDWVDAALPAEKPAGTPPLPLAAQMAGLDMREPGWFIIRFVFEQPNCAPLVPPLLSEASAPFQMASFFDHEAPARPIRIALPLDTTAAGLRKFDKNTAFMISDVLCGQMQRMGSLTLGDLVLSVLPWPLHKDLSVPEGGACAEDGLSFGMICSLSIPIITICALILLMIIVNLLNIIFKWIPFFIMCFPLPNFKAKEA